MPDFYAPNGEIYDIDPIEFTYSELIDTAIKGVLRSEDFKIKTLKKDDTSVYFLKIVMENGDVYVNTFEKIQKRVLRLCHDSVLTNYFIARPLAKLTDEPKEYNNVKFVKSFVQNTTNLESEIKKRLSDAFDKYLNKQLEQVHNGLTN
jgi:hypothetical protein